MRDLTKYPITQKEIVECLLSTANQIDAEQAAGDMRPTLLNLAAMIVVACPVGMKERLIEEAHNIDGLAKKFAAGLTQKSSK